MGLPLNKIATLIPKLLLILLLAGLIYGYFFFKNPDNFPVKNIQIEASYQHINPQALQQVIAPYIKGGFFSLNVSKIRKHIMELPWVYAVNISRTWPDGIVINVSEQIPVACWNGNSLLNSDGDIFTPDKSTMPDNLPLLLGTDDQAVEVLQYYGVMNQDLSAINLAITQLDLDAQGSWHLLLNNGITVLLGNSSIVNRLQIFIKAYHKVIGAKEKDVARVDLRYNAGFSIKWKKYAVIPAHTVIPAHAGIQFY